jgi:hypothetical protein
LAQSELIECIANKGFFVGVFAPVYVSSLLYAFVRKRENLKTEKTENAKI